MPHKIPDMTGGHYTVSSFYTPSGRKQVSISYWHPGRRSGGSLTCGQAALLAEVIANEAENEYETSA